MVHAWSNDIHTKMQMCLTELFGTTILNLSIAMHYSGSTFDGFHPLAVASTIIIIVNFGAPISGAHYNPALTAAFYFGGSRRCPSPTLYIAISVIAAAFAHLLALGLATDAHREAGYPPGLPVVSSTADWVRAAAGELLGTYLATFNVLYVALLSETPMGNYGPVIVGLGFYSCILSFMSVRSFASP